MRVLAMDRAILNAVLTADNLLARRILGTQENPQVLRNKAPFRSA
jgi:hypothetical protein